MRRAMHAQPACRPTCLHNLLAESALGSLAAVLCLSLQGSMKGPITQTINNVGILTICSSDRVHEGSSGRWRRKEEKNKHKTLAEPDDGQR
ncbi:hypothetical protein BKA80DRAFT_285052 [Phyllosticta citrichinensis]